MNDFGFSRLRRDHARVWDGDSHCLHICIEPFRAIRFSSGFGCCRLSSTSCKETQRKKNAAQSYGNTAQFTANALRTTSTSDARHLRCKNAR